MYMAPTSTSEGGYTLMELLVVISLLVMLSTAVLSINSSSRQIAKLDAAARQVESFISYAQSLGTGGREYPSGSMKFDNGYGAYVNSNAGKNTTLILFGGRGDDPTVGLNNVYDDAAVPAPGVNFVDSEALVNGVTVAHVCINNTPAACGMGAGDKTGSIMFRRGYPGAVIQKDKNDSPKLTCRIKLTSGTFSTYICAYSTGLITRSNNADCS